MGTTTDNQFVMTQNHLGLRYAKIHHHQQVTVTKKVGNSANILLMEEIMYHLGWYWNLVNNGIFTTSTVDRLISKTMNRIGIPESQYETPACCMFGPGRVACDTQWNPFYNSAITPFITSRDPPCGNPKMKTLRCFLGNFSLTSKLTTIPQYQLSQGPKVFSNAKKRSGPHLDVTT